MEIWFVFIHHIARCYAAYMMVCVKISAFWTLHIALGWWMWLHFPLMFGSPDQLLSKPQLPACPGRQTPLCCFSVVVLKSMGSKGASSVLFWDLYYAEANATWSNERGRRDISRARMKVRKCLYLQGKKVLVVLFRLFNRSTKCANSVEPVNQVGHRWGDSLSL